MANVLQLLSMICTIRFMIYRGIYAQQNFNNILCLWWRSHKFPFTSMVSTWIALRKCSKKFVDRMRVYMISLMYSDNCSFFRALTQVIHILCCFADLANTLMKELGSATWFERFWCFSIEISTRSLGIFSTKLFHRTIRERICCCFLNNNKIAEY